MAAATDVRSRTMPIILWVLRALMAALFLFAAFAKLTSMEVYAFAMLPVGQWFRYLVGLLELLGGICVLIPAISGLGAIVLFVVDVGAFFAQILTARIKTAAPINVAFQAPCWATSRFLTFDAASIEA